MTIYNYDPQRTSGVLPLLILIFAAFIARADSFVDGPNPICPATTNTFSAVSTTTAVGFTWSISTNTGNTASAAILSDTTNTTVDVVATNGGVFTLECLV